MHSALRIVAFSLAFLPGRISSSKICIPSCLRETTPHASSDIFQRKRAISFFSFFFLFPLEETGKKTRTKTQVDRSEAVEWNFQNDWGRHFENKGMLRRNNLVYRIYQQTRRIHDFERRRDGPNVGWIQISSDLFAKRYRAWLESTVGSVRRVHLVAPPDCERTLQIGRKERLCHLRFTSNFISTRGKCMQIIPLANRGERAKAPPVITNSRDYPISLGQEAANTGSPACSRVVKSREKSRPVTIRRPLSKIDWIEYRSGPKPPANSA